MMAKRGRMKYWNGRVPVGFGDRELDAGAMICARSQAEAVRLASEAFGGFTIGELRNYWSPVWGTAAEAVLGEQAEPGVFIRLHDSFFRFEGAFERERGRSVWD